MILVAIVALAFTVEAALGFGATLIAVALGSLTMRIDAVLYAFVPLNLALSCAIVLRARRAVNTRMLASRILPAMAAGFPVGLYAFERLPGDALKLVFAAFVFILAGLELLRLFRRSGLERPLSPALALALLLMGGVVHGAFATGGPPVVYVCGRTLPDKASFRATMSALWLVLNGALVVVYAATGRVNGSTLVGSASLAPGLIVGLVAGDTLHGRIPERAFRTFIFVTLLVVAAVLAIRR